VFYDAVNKALEEEQTDLIPIVSITSKKEKNHCKKLEDFSVDYMLPVQVGHDWVGVVFRDNDCAMALLDGYDITNKAILCNPAFDARSLEWFRNRYTRLKVIPDETMMRRNHPTLNVMVDREHSLETQLSMQSMDSVTVSPSTITEMMDHHRSPSISSGISGYSAFHQSPGSKSCASSVSVTPFTLSPTPSASVSASSYNEMNQQMMTVESQCTLEWIKYCDEVIQHAMTVKEYYGQFLPSNLGL